MFTDGGGVYLQAVNNQNVFNLSSEGSYEIECFVRPTAASAGNIFAIRDGSGELLTLALDTTAKVTVTAATFGLTGTAASALTLNTFQHVVLRLSGGTAAVFVDGGQVISQAMTAGVTLAATEARLGGFAGQIDEFRFRHAAGSGYPEVPGQPYQGTLKAADLGGTGDGSFGDVTISTAGVQINTYAMVASVSGGQTLTIGSQNEGVYGAFAVGNEVMVHASLKKSVSEGDLGKYALRRITSIGSGIITLNKPVNGEPDFNLSASFLSNYHVQILSVPNYNNLTVTAAGTIVPLQWGESYGGGIVALKCKNTLILDGKILTTGKGPLRTDSLTISNAQLIEQFVLTGNVLIVARQVVAGDNARIGAEYNGAMMGGAGGLAGSLYYTSNSLGGPGGAGVVGYGGGGGGGGGAEGYGGVGGSGTQGQDAVPSGGGTYTSSGSGGGSAGYGGGTTLYNDGIDLLPSNPGSIYEGGKVGGDGRCGHERAVNSDEALLVIDPVGHGGGGGGGGTGSLAGGGGGGGGINGAGGRGGYLTYTTLERPNAGSNVILICKVLNISKSVISTGGAGGYSDITNPGIYNNGNKGGDGGAGYGGGGGGGASRIYEEGGSGGGGTGFAYIACEVLLAA